MEVDIVASIAIAAVLIFVVGQIGRTMRTAALHRTLRRAIENGQTINPDIIDKLDRPSEPGAGDERIGYVLVALSLALFAAGAINPGDNNWVQLATVALFPLFVGAALLIRLRLAKRNRAEP
jgi:hypothetical protein